MVGPDFSAPIPNDPNVALYKRIQDLERSVQTLQSAGAPIVPIIQPSRPWWGFTTSESAVNEAELTSWNGGENSRIIIPTAAKNQTWEIVMQAAVRPVTANVWLPFYIQADIVETGHTTPIVSYQNVDSVNTVTSPLPGGGHKTCVLHQLYTVLKDVSIEVRPTIGRISPGSGTLNYARSSAASQFFVRRVA